MFGLPAGCGKINRFRLQRIPLQVAAMRNLVIGVLILGVIAWFGARWKLHHDVEEGVDMALLMMAPFAMIEYEGVSSTLTGELTINGIRGRVSGFADDFHIDRLGIDTPSFLSLMSLGKLDRLAAAGSDALPEDFGVIVEGLRMPTGADYGRQMYAARIAALGVSDADLPANACTGKYGLSPQALAAMGYSEYDFSMTARFRDLGDRYVIELHTRSEEMWDIAAELRLVGNMALELARGPRYRPKMDRMRIVYEDLSLKDRIADYCRELGLSDAEILAAQLDAFRHLGAQGGIEFDEYVIEPYRDFLDGKSVLVFTAKPIEPVSLSAIPLYKPSDVPALLQLSAETL